MRPIDHTLKSHDERKHAKDAPPYQFHKDPHTTWKVQVPADKIAVVHHSDGRITRHDDDVELPKGSTLLKFDTPGYDD